MARRQRFPRLPATNDLQIENERMKAPASFISPIMRRSTLLAIAILVISAACTDEARLRRRIKNTVASAGFIGDEDKIYAAMRSELKIYDPRPGECLGEIGAGSGWLAGTILMIYDSLVYYANDVDDAAIRSIRPVTEQFSTLRVTSPTSRLYVVKGSARKTNLPHNLFDKIIIRETLHHLEDADAILGDVYLSLKPNGKAFVYEPAVDSSTYSRECGATLLPKSRIVQSMSRHRLALVAEYDLHDSPGNMPSWWMKASDKPVPKKVFVFEKREP